jgi:hypothetical protein
MHTQCRGRLASACYGFLQSPSSTSVQTSGSWLAIGGYVVVQLQQARPSCAGDLTPKAGALDQSLCTVRGISYSNPDGVIELEASVAIGVRAAIFKKSTCWRI